MSFHKVLAIDFGVKRIGLAIGDSESNTKQNDSYNTKNDFSLLLCALLQTCKSIMDGQ